MTAPKNRECVGGLSDAMDDLDLQRSVECSHRFGQNDEDERMPFSLT